MAWLTISLAWFAATVIRGRPRPFASGAIAAGLVAVFALGAVNPHAFVARTNVARADVLPVDYAYLWSLGADATPWLLPRLDAIPEADRCDAIGRAVRRWGPEASEREGVDDWRRWNASTARARTAVAAELPRLEAILDGCADEDVTPGPAATTGAGTAGP
jgi:hypothetical protein